MESVSIKVNKEVHQAAKEFAEEFDFNKMDTMIHRFPAGLGGIRFRYPYIVPRFVAIGPYHHGKEHLMKMERVKMAAAKHFCGLMCLQPQKVMNEEKVRDAVKRARGEYIDINKKDKEKEEEGTKDGHDESSFAAMMFYDACFLLLYMDAYFRSYGKEEDNVVNKSMRRFLFSNRESIDNDIMLLENQLPWPVLQAIMSVVPKEEKRDGLKRAVGKFIARMGNTFRVSESVDRREYVWDDANNPPPHLLALLWRHITEPREPESNPLPVLECPLLNNCFKFRNEPDHTQGETPYQLLTQEQNDETHQLITVVEQKDEENPKVKSISTVSPMELEEIGIKLKASKTAAFSDMGFVERPLVSKLTLAPLSLSDARASCLVNMAAFEVCTASRYGDDPDRTAVCSYIALLAMFMVREEDVHTLRSKGLLHGPHSNMEMLAFFKTVAKHLPDSGKRFAYIMKDIAGYKEKRYIWTPIYKWTYNYYMTVIKVISILVTLIGLYKALLSLTNHS